MALTRKANPLMDVGSGLVVIAATSAVGVLLRRVAPTARHRAVRARAAGTPAVLAALLALLRYDTYLRTYGPVSRFSWRHTGRTDPEKGEEKLARVRPPQGGFRSAWRTGSAASNPSDHGPYPRSAS